MSMMRCDGCSKLIDTDDDPDCFDSEGHGFCEPCRDRHWEDGLALAAEHESEVIQPQRDRQDIIDAGRGHLLNEHVAEPFRSILNKFYGA